MTGPASQTKLGEFSKSALTTSRLCAFCASLKRTTKARTSCHAFGGSVSARVALAVAMSAARPNTLARIIFFMHSLYPAKTRFDDAPFREVRHRTDARRHHRDACGCDRQR